MISSRNKFKCGESGLVRIGEPPLKRVIREGFSEEEVSASEAGAQQTGQGWESGKRETERRGWQGLVLAGLVSCGKHLNFTLNQGLTYYRWWAKSGPASVLIKFYWHMPMPTHLHIICGCFYDNSRVE